MSARFGYKSPYPKERARLIGYAYFSSFPPFSESRSPFLLLYPIFFSDTCRIHQSEQESGFIRCIRNSNEDRIRSKCISDTTSFYSSFK